MHFIGRVHVDCLEPRVLTSVRLSHLSQYRRLPVSSESSESWEDLVIPGDQRGEVNHPTEGPFPLPPGHHHHDHHRRHYRQDLLQVPTQTTKLPMRARRHMRERRDCESMTLGAATFRYRENGEVNSPPLPRVHCVVCSQCAQE